MTLLGAKPEFLGEQLVGAPAVGVVIEHGGDHHLVGLRRLDQRRQARTHRRLRSDHEARPVARDPATGALPVKRLHRLLGAGDFDIFAFPPAHKVEIDRGRKPVRFRVTLDGKVPGADAGTDIAPDGTGTVKQQQLYQLIRQKGEIRDRTFTIEFLDPGAEAFAFTFG